MAWTSTDLDAIKAARLALAKGERVRSVQLNGRRLEYSEITDANLAKLQAEIEAEISTAGRRKAWLARSGGKGL